MSIASDHVPLFRTHWADRLVDTCTGRRITGRGAINPTTRIYDSPVTIVVYATGPCLVRPATGESLRVFGEESQTRIDYLLVLPNTASGINPDDEFTVDTSVNDAEMVGKILIVRGTNIGSYRTVTKLGCELKAGGGLQV